MTSQSIIIWGNTPLAAWLTGKLPDTVTWLTDEQHRDAIQADGLHINGERVDGVSILTELTELPSLILLASPQWFTAQAMMKLRALIPFDQTPPPVVCLQMGVGGADAIHALFGEGIAMTGVITKTIRYGINTDRTPNISYIIAEEDGGAALQNEHPAHQQVKGLLQQAGLSVVGGSAEEIGWSSVFWGIQANALSTILNIDPAEVYRDSALWKIEHEQLREALGIIQRLGVKLVPLPDVNVPRIAQFAKWFPKAFATNALARQPRPPSLKDDLLAETKRSDAAYLNGAVAYAAHRIGLRTPINHALAITVTDIAEGRALWSQYQGSRKLLEATLRLARG